MKLEQACRFALEVTGYGISASSEGFSEKNKTNLENAFNDGLNPTFDKVGSCIMEVKTSGEDVFLALCTMRSDMSSRSARKTIFTNAVCMPIELYRQVISTHPEIILSLRADQFLSSQPGIQLLPQYELNEEVPQMNLDYLRERWELDRRDYADFLYKIYYAMLSGGTVCIDTAADFGKAIPIVQEFAYCALRGILPCMRERITFSSARDARNVISIASDAGGSWNMEGLEFYHFAAEKKERSAADYPAQDPVNDREMVWLICEEIATREDHERENFLNQLEQWIGQLTQKKTCSIPLLLLSYYDQFRAENTLREAVYLLFHGLDNELQDQTADNALLNRVLSKQIRFLASNNACPNHMILQKMLLRVISAGDEELTAAACALTKCADVQECFALLDTTIRADYTRQAEALVRGILEREDVRETEWADELNNNLLLWCCRNNIQGIEELCFAHLQGDNERPLNLIFDDKESDCESSVHFTETEQIFIVICVKEILKTGAKLPDDLCDKIDQNYPAFDEQHKSFWIDYIIQRRLRELSDTDSRVRFIQNNEDKFPTLIQDLCNAIKKKESGLYDLWEAYQAIHVLSEKMNLQEMSDACADVNEFMVSDGRFEKRLCEIWMEVVRNRFLVRKNEADPKIQLFNILQAELTDIVTLESSLNCSLNTRENLRNQTIDSFWKNIDYSVLIRPDLIVNVSEETVQIRDSQDAEVKNKIHFLGLMQRFEPETDEMREEIIRRLTDIIINGADGNFRFIRNEKISIQKALRICFRRTLRKKRFLLWDLLVLVCWNVDEEKPIVNIEKMEAVLDRCDQDQMLWEIDERSNDPVMLKYSYLLYGNNRNEKLCKELRRGIHRNSHAYLVELASELKDESDSFFDRIGRGFRS